MNWILQCFRNMPRNIFTLFIQQPAAVLMGFFIGTLLMMFFPLVFRAVTLSYFTGVVLIVFGLVALALVCSREIVRLAIAVLILAGALALIIAALALIFAYFPERAKLDIIQHVLSFFGYGNVA